MIFPIFFGELKDKISAHILQSKLANMIIHYEDLNLKKDKLQKKLSKYEVKMQKIHLDIKNIHIGGVL